MKRIAAGFGIALAVFAAFTVLSFLSITRIADTVALRTQTFDIIERLENFLDYLDSAADARAAYIITGKEAYLEPYYTGAKILDIEKENLRKLLSGRPRQQQRLDTLAPLIQEMFSNIEKSVELRRAGRLDIPAQRGLLNETLRIKGAVKSVIADMVREERERLSRLGGESTRIATEAIFTFMMGSLVSFLILYGFFTLLGREIAERRQAEDRLNRHVNELEQRNREIGLFSKMGRMLQACTTAEEGHAVIARSVQGIFPAESGAVYLIDTGKNLASEIAVWGEAKRDEELMAPGDCWALRLGRLYQVDDPRSGTLCPHIKHPVKAAYICVPMAAQNETMGLLHLEFDSVRPDRPEEERKRLIGHRQRLAVAVAESIALSLANFRLRETLYRQSIQDPMTGLFNRRFMEELLDRELHRMSRKGRSLGIIMLDIDHFKLFNDTFGHEAGDMLLREIGVFLRTHIREEDFACRYGGEEFVIILPETALESARQRAEQLRKDFRNLNILSRGRTLGPVTVSLGVSAFPENGTTSGELLRSADAALYRAKAEGRDRVETAQRET